ncbi:hypothetical protein PIROE2DRAFT_13494 [Piromyces sp. E2]|nr:hypothetical protein PIROE2DRAFT_13494 [Piromyces sp. E2]|eukprot:OUM60677.1 hypothetical protein PIROE2DRAFT_13494 [Piromyces sp. E2]
MQSLIEFLDSFNGIINRPIDSHWKRPVIIMLIIHWVTRFIGDILREIMLLGKKEPNTNWPHSNKNWLIGQALAHTFWLISEIIGDWYPLVRTKAVTNNKKMKIFGIYCYYKDFPMDLRVMDENGVKIRMKQYNQTNINSYHTTDSGIEQLRQTVLNINYNLMYIDQILLILFVEKNNLKPKDSSKSSFSSSNSKSTQNNTNYSYHKYNFTNESCIGSATSSMNNTFHTDSYLIKKDYEQSDPPYILGEEFLNMINHQESIPYYNFNMNNNNLYATDIPSSYEYIPSEKYKKNLRNNYIMNEINIKYVIDYL